MDGTKTDLIFTQTLEYLIKSVQEMGKSGMSQEQIAKRLGLSQGMVSMLLSGQRGEGIKYKTALKAFKAIGGDMAKLLNDILDQREASVLIAIADEDQELFEDLICVLGSKGPERDKLKSEIKYLKKQLSS